MGKVTDIRTANVSKNAQITNEVPEFVRVAALVGLATFLTYLAQGLTDLVANIGHK